MNTRLGIRLMYSNAEHVQRDPLKFWSLLEASPGQDPIDYCAVINNALLLKSSVTPELHAELEAEFTDDCLRGVIEQRRQQSEGLLLLFNRPALLITLKLLLGLDRGTDGGIPLTRIGELILHANDYVELSDEIWDSDPELLDMLANFAPIWELKNPRDVFQLFVRTYLLLTEHVAAHPKMTELFREQLGAEPSKLPIDGLVIDDYLALVFGIHTSVQKGLLTQKSCVIDMDQFFRITTLPGEGVRAFLARRSGDSNEFRAQLKLAFGSEAFVAYIQNGATAMDATIIKQRPLFRRPDGRHVVLDRRFLIELLSTTLYWTIFDAIPEKKRRNDFSTHWGECFEAFVLRELEVFYPSISGLLQTRIAFPGGEIDAFLDFGDFVIVIEIKSGLLAKDPRLMRDPNTLREELHKKFVDGSGVSQLVKGARALAMGQVKTARRDCRVYPILVGDEPVLQCFVANRYLDEQFAGQFTERPANVAPLTVMLIDELEELLPHVTTGDVGWREVLDARVDEDGVSPDSFHTTLASMCAAKHIPRRRNEFLSEQGKRIGKLITDRYRFDDTKAR
jgi:hypothetical protein